MALELPRGRSGDNRGQVAVLFRGVLLRASYVTFLLTKVLGISLYLRSTLAASFDLLGMARPDMFTEYGNQQT